MHANTRHHAVPVVARRGSHIPGSGVRDGCEAPRGCWELTSASSSQNKTKTKTDNLGAEEMIEWVKEPVAKPDSVSLILGTKGRRHRLLKVVL